ncbi:cryptochrome/photolyase family protein [Holospora curviuscula]|uniref:Deoxyribodipyrimidine photo-lyase n=1 Tax=Holospora curviuscula TaxID=1082868 RepID=A0A2S5R7E4_9PROT|nr:deoxyribodipyrimidine photo-lyase [Holospora curviuscula]PPE03238.1 Deoxyribodipyrimidine photo-lyase [Holospora curviuscula]
MKQCISIFWFRQDLRLTDNPGLLEASRLGKVLPIYILDDLAPSSFKSGSASKIYLHYSLERLNETLRDHLNIYIGTPEKIILQLIQQYNVEHLFWNHCYEPWTVLCDEAIEKILRDLKINYTIFNGSYLWVPKDINKEDGGYYKVFSAYKKKVCSLEPRSPLPKPEHLILMRDHENNTRLADLKLTSNVSWRDKIEKYWDFGEESAMNKLNNFLRNGLPGYKKERDYPGRKNTSHLSVNLHFGEISPYQIWHSVKAIDPLKVCSADKEHFLSEVIWREFSCYLLTHFKKLPFDNFQTKFNAFPWKDNTRFLEAWRSGTTGYPVVDAGMRQLWQTGYMHNRVRMIVASFLVKNLMIHWHHGRDWFWECLVDGDLANNSASWQWVAGCGADAAPYFRIFNPILQGEKFDPDGEYTKKFVPELEHLPNTYVFSPWKAPEAVLKDAGITLGQSYPLPIVDMEHSRNTALESYRRLPSMEIMV